jgi:hypothetical protein
MPSSPPHPEPPPSPRRKDRLISPILLGFAVILAVAAAAFYFVVFRGPAVLVDKGMETAERSYDLARKLAKDVVKALQIQPQVTIGSEVVYEQTKGILELATVERRFAQSYTWEESWLGSTKRIELKGTFVAKAGYDMTQPFVVNISPDGKEVRARVPPPKILSMELLTERVLQDEGGFWNTLNSADRENAGNELLKLARANVEKSNLKTEAEAELLKRLRAAADLQGPVKVAVTVSGQ